MARKAAVKTRRTTPAPTPAAVRVRQFDRLEAAAIASGDGVLVRYPATMADELLRAITTTVHATIPGGQKSRHVAPAIAKAVKAVCDNLRRRGRRA